MCVLQVSQSIRFLGEMQYEFSFAHTNYLIEVSICTFAVDFCSSLVLLSWIAVRCSFVHSFAFSFVRPQIRDCDEMVLFDPS